METTTTTPVPLTAHLASTADAGASHTPPTGVHLGREHVISWTPEVWERIDGAVHHEMHRTRVAAKFLPHHKVDPHVTTQPAESVVIRAAVPLNIDEGAFIRLIEIWTEFSLTAAQVQEETKAHAGHSEHHGDDVAHGSHETHDAHDHHKHHPSSTAITLARRAANNLSLAQDTVIFQGLNAFNAVAAAPASPLGSSLFANQTVQSRGTPADTGLLCTGGTNLLPGGQVLQVAAIPPAGGAAVYSTNTVAKINTAYAMLAGSGYSGPYVTVLHFYPYADSLAPLASTLVLPADRIKPLMEAGYYPSSTIGGIAAPQDPVGAGPVPQAYGLVISLGGNTVDLVNGLDPITAFSQVDATGNFTFRVLTRFALRVKDTGAIIRLEFQ